MEEMHPLIKSLWHLHRAGLMPRALPVMEVAFLEAQIHFPLATLMTHKQLHRSS